MMHPSENVHLTGEILKNEVLDRALLTKIVQMFKLPSYSEHIRAHNKVLYDLLGCLCDPNYYKEVTRYSADPYDKVTHDCVCYVWNHIQQQQAQELATLLRKFSCYEGKDITSKTFENFCEALKMYEQHYQDTELDITLHKSKSKNYDVDDDNFFRFFDSKEFTKFAHNIRQVNHGKRRTIFDQLYNSICAKLKPHGEFALSMSFTYTANKRHLYVEVFSASGGSLFMHKQAINIQDIKLLMDGVLDRKTPYDQMFSASQQDHEDLYDDEELD